MKLRQKAKKYLHILCDQMKSDTSIALDQSQLRNAFKVAVKGLPEGPLKTELVKNTTEYFEKLQSLLDACDSAAEAELALTEPKFKQVDFPYNLMLHKKSAKVDEIDRFLTQQETHEQIDTCFLRQTLQDLSEEDLHNVLERCRGSETPKELAKYPWLADVHRLCSASLLSSEGATLQKTMSFFQSNVSSCLEKALKAPKKKSLQLVKTETEKFLLYSQWRKQNLKEMFSAPSYEDLLAAILSAYVDIMAAVTSEEDYTTASRDLCALVVYLLRDLSSHVLDVLLQTTALSSGHILLIQPLYRHIVGILHKSGEAGNVKIYTKLVLTQRWWKNTMGKDDSDSSPLTAAPLSYLDWLRSVSPASVEEMPVTSKFKGLSITNFILQEATEGLADILLDALTQEPEADADSDPDDLDPDESSHQLYFVDTEGNQPKNTNQGEQTNGVDRPPMFVIDKAPTKSNLGDLQGDLDPMTSDPNIPADIDPFVVTSEEEEEEEEDDDDVEVLSETVVLSDSEEAETDDKESLPEEDEKEEEDEVEIIKEDIDFDKENMKENVKEKSDKEGENESEHESEDDENGREDDDDDDDNDDDNDDDDDDDDGDEDHSKDKDGTSVGDKGDGTDGSGSSGESEDPEGSDDGGSHQDEVKEPGDEISGQKEQNGGETGIVKSKMSLKHYEIVTRGKNTPGTPKKGQESPSKNKQTKHEVDTGHRVDDIESASQVNSCPVKASPAKSSPVKASPAKSSPVKASPAKSSPVKASPAKSSPVKASPAKASPAEASPVKKAQGSSTKSPRAPRGEDSDPVLGGQGSEADPEPPGSPILQSKPAGRHSSRKGTPVKSTSPVKVQTPTRSVDPETTTEPEKVEKDDQSGLSPAKRSRRSSLRRSSISKEVKYTEVSESEDSVVLKDTADVFDFHSDSDVSPIKVRKSVTRSTDPASPHWKKKLLLEDIPDTEVPSPSKSVPRSRRLAELQEGGATPKKRRSSLFSISEDREMNVADKTQDRTPLSSAAESPKKTPVVVLEKEDLGQTKVASKRRSLPAHLAADGPRSSPRKRDGKKPDSAADDGEGEEMEITMATPDTVGSWDGSGLRSGYSTRQRKRRTSDVSLGEAGVPQDWSGLLPGDTGLLSGVTTRLRRRRDSEMSDMSLTSVDSEVITKKRGQLESAAALVSDSDTESVTSGLRRSTRSRRSMVAMETEGHLPVTPQKSGTPKSVKKTSTATPKSARKATSATPGNR